MDKGFVILAQNTDMVDYVKCAEILKKSILKSMPAANVTIITDLPYGDQAPDSNWKLINDWQVYEASPYEYTIKLEADMYIPNDISYWWDVLQERDLVVSTTIRDYKNNISESKFYRKFIVDNKLPDVYNALTYFKKCDFSEQFFLTVRNIFENWEEYKQILKCDPNEPATTDFVYAIACHIMGIENTTLPDFDQFSMIHMKKFINNTLSDNWTNELVYEFTEPLRVQTFPQLYPFHYHVKNFSYKLEKNYG
jgi:hypothetical protein